MSERAAIVVLTQAGLETARRFQAVVEGSEIHGYRPRVVGAQAGFDEVGPHLRQLFESGATLIGVCATGILVRSLAAAIGDKHAEPAVIAVAEDASTVVPVLGGHRGANQLSERIAQTLGAHAAVTTVSDTRWGVALDEPPHGWALANPGALKGFVARLLAGDSCRLDGDAAWLGASELPFDDEGELHIVISEKPCSADEGRLVYHPQRLALGVGCERGTEPAELAALVRRTLARHELSAQCVAGVYSIDVKADERAVLELGHELACPVRFFDAATLERETPRLANPSATVFREVGCHGVAEAAALAAAGPGARLTVTKEKSRRATCALARAVEVLDGAAAGRPRGRLVVLGLGPGRSDWRTPAVERAVREATYLVGYSGYLAQLTAMPSQTLLDYALGEETERVDQALELAAAGNRVALVCSGDPGIYAMASLVFERLAQATQPGWRRAEIVVLPGVSAMHAAAALSGAPLGHDFCAISLSDLLTPWAVIEQRLEAAARGNFVVALYNPASERRRRGLERALEILRGHRPAQTPVVVARQVGRGGESLAVVRLDELDPSRVDMMTLLIIGASDTRTLCCSGRQWVFTPRGYGPTTPAEPSS